MDWVGGAVVLATSLGRVDIAVDSVVDERGDGGTYSDEVDERGGSSDAVVMGGLRR